ncbi:hypothetical protein [Desulfonatronospira sp.]|uniref:hypothetical protein n=1 Tax=Desulfonatronospira sp. TaxID=1962951 RepID=UPI0025B91D62|nr:hypothetical protein [Desulfonatronospira sp.]
MSGSYYTTPMRCVRCCRHFPCSLFTRDDVDGYIARELIAREFTGFKIRRTKMYLFKKTDGTLVEAPEDFDPKEPDWNRMQEVEEVLVIGKVLVPQMKLVPKTQSSGDKKSSGKAAKSPKTDK